MYSQYPPQEGSHVMSPTSPTPGYGAGGGPPVADFQRMNLGGGGGGGSSGQLSAGGNVICGPLLKYISTDYRRGIYRGSCLIVSDHVQPPVLTVTLKTARSGRTKQVTSQGEQLDCYRNQYRFWRFELQLPFDEEPQLATYTSPCLNNQPYSFHIPGYYEAFRFMFHSCNGFSDIPQETKDKFGEKEAPLWQDVLDRHRVMPFHVLLGGGDQLYQDCLLKEDFMKPWNSEKDPNKRVNMKLSNEMRSGFEQFYMFN